MGFMTKQMNNLSLKFKRIDAISDEDAIFRNSEKYWNTWERPLKNTEKACLLSHIEAWKVVLKNNQPALILEDDACLSIDTKLVLQSASKLENTDLLSLEVRFRKKLLSKKRKKLFLGYSVSKLYQNGSGAAAYILWPTGAEKLILRSSQHAALADALISNFRKLNAFQIEPACALQLDCLSLHGIQSPIRHQSIINKGKYSVRPVYEKRTRIKFFIKRVISQIIKGFQLLYLMPISEKRHIILKKNKFK
jgi:glycosyl transferase family 25